MFKNILLYLKENKTLKFLLQKLILKNYFLCLKVFIRYYNHYIILTFSFHVIAHLL